MSPTSPPPPPQQRRRRRVPRRAAAIRASASYDESLVDSLLQSHLGAAAGRRHRRLRRLRHASPSSRQRETETEALIALSLGFPIDRLLPSEQPLLAPASLSGEVNGDVVNDYLVVRNHILATWRADVRTPLPRAAVLETVAARYDSLVAAAHSFLSREGHINFGVSSSFPASPTSPPATSSSASVIVIGAGLAGLAAARQLLRFGLKVLVLEGRDRPGGRVFTTKLAKSAAAELGGSVITGIHANPLGVLARQLAIPLHKIRDRCPLYAPDGREVEARLDSDVNLVFNKLLDHATQVRQATSDLAEGMSLGSAIERLRMLYNVARSKEERELLDWHLANLEFSNAGCLSELSLAHWDQDDPYEMGGDHCFLAGGNSRLIHALCEDVPVLYQKTVTRIEYGDEGVCVAVEGGQVFQADMALCTVPLGVLKSGSIVFDPELPTRKQEAVQRLGFGLLNKVAMVFPYVFWDEELDTFGCLNEDRSKRGEFFLFYGYHTVSGGAVLIALVAGEAALAFEKVDPVISLHRVLSILRGIYGPKGVCVPDPIQSVCTRWGGDPLCCGSYSHVRVGSSGNDYDILAESISGRLFFAGEATNRKYPATMHGALLSGLREASCILHAAENRAMMNSDQKKYLQKSLRNCNDVLLDLFKEPDLAFGIFSFVFSSLTMDDPEAMGLVRVSLDKCGRGHCKTYNLEEEPEDHQSTSETDHQALHLYAILSREQAHQIQLVSGDDKTRLELLCKEFSLKLMGFDSTCALGSSLIFSILSARKSRKRLFRRTNYKTSH